MCHRTCSLAIATAATIGLSACGPDPFYLPGLAVGQVDAVLHSMPIERAIDSDMVTEEQRRKLALIQDVRAYAVENIGLVAGQSFTTYVDLSRASSVYNVSAARRDRFEARTWEFLIVGTVPYLAFYDEQRALRQAKTLEEEGYDVFVYEVDAYSTLNYFPNPVRSTMLQRDDISLIDTVIHELLHNTVWRPGDAVYSESLATFFGRAGAIAYLRDRFPDNPDLVQFARERYQDSDRYNDFIFDLYNELDTLYQSDLSSERKIADREARYQAARERFVADVHPLMHQPSRYDWVADLPTNNAWMLGNYRYNLDLELFADVFDALNGDWPNAIATFRAAARSADPKAYLRDWLAAPDAAAKSGSAPLFTAPRVRDPRSLAHALAEPGAQATGQHPTPRWTLPPSNTPPIRSPIADAPSMPAGHVPPNRPPCCKPDPGALPSDLR